MFLCIILLYLQQIGILAVVGETVFKKRPQNREISPPGVVIAVSAVAAMAAVRAPGIWIINDMRYKYLIVKSLD